MTDESARLYYGIKQHDHWTLKNGKSGSIVNLIKKNEDHMTNGVLKWHSRSYH